jgi:hypothetical protein
MLVVCEISSALPVFEGARDRVAELRLDGSNLGLRSYRLFVRGKTTAVTVETSNDSEAPTLTTKIAADGTVCGTVAHVESGAYTETLSIAFVVSKHGFWSKYQAEIGGVVGGRVLVVPVQRGPWAEPDSAVLFVHDKLIDVGTATAAYVRKDGSVAGWFYATSDGMPTRGLLNEAGPTFKQYFIWKNGHRMLLGRKSTG